MELLAVEKMAEIVVVPRPIACTKPPVCTVTAAALVELQVALKLMSCVDPSLNVAVATNCLTTPSGMLLLAGVTASETMVALVIVKVADPDIEPDEAAIDVVPGETAVTTPVLLTDATPGCEELHITELVTSCIVPSVKVPMALNCSSIPDGMDALLRTTDKETIAAAITDTVVDPLTPEVAAVMLTVPWAKDESSPAALIAPTFVFEEPQLTVVVRSRVLPSE